MELFQVNWDEKDRLFLEFMRNKEEKLHIIPETVKRINIRFEISRLDKEGPFNKQLPYLVSVRKFYFTEELLSFSIDLDEISHLDELQIEFLHLSIFLNSGKRIEISISQKFELTEICYDEECYDRYDGTCSNIGNKFNVSFSQEKVYEEVQTDFKTQKEKRTRIYERSTVSATGLSDDIVSMIRENNERLKRVENELTNVSMTLKSIELNGSSFPRSGPIVRGPPRRGIERIKRSNAKSVIKPSQKMLFLKELKIVLKNSTKEDGSFNFRDVLKPMSEIEFKAIILDEEDLLKKGEEAINNQIERIKKEEIMEEIIEEKEEKVLLENLKLPN